MQKTILMKLGIDKYTAALKTWVTGQISDSSAKIKGLSYDSNKKELSILDLDDKSIGTPLDVSDFIVDGMLADVVPETDASGKNTGVFDFMFKTSDSDEPVKHFSVDFGKYVDTYTADDDTIKLTGSEFSVNKVYDDQTTIKEDIIIMGGPLANNFPSDWKGANGEKAIPKGKTLEEILKALVYKKVKGSVSWGTPTMPTYTINKPTVYLSKSGTVEVGTKVSISTLNAGSATAVTRSVTCTATHGYFNADSDGNPTATHNSSKNLTIYASGSVTGSPSFSGKWNTSALNETKVGTELIVEEGVNTLEVTQSGQTANWNKFPYTKVFAAYNDGTIAKDAYAELKETTAPSSQSLSESNSATITAYYKYYIGYSKKTDPALYTPNDITSLSTKSGWITGSTVTDTMTSDGNSIMIACPNTYILNGVSNSVGAPILAKFQAGTVKDVEIGGGSKITYNIYVYPITNNVPVEFKNVNFTKIK